MCLFGPAYDFGAIVDSRLFVVRSALSTAERSLAPVWLERLRRCAGDSGVSAGVETGDRPSDANMESTWSLMPAMNDLRDQLDRRSLPLPGFGLSIGVSGVLGPPGTPHASWTERRVVLGPPGAPHASSTERRVPSPSAEEPTPPGPDNSRTVVILAFALRNREPALLGRAPSPVAGLGSSSAGNSSSGDIRANNSIEGQSW